MQVKLNFSGITCIVVIVKEIQYQKTNNDLCEMCSLMPAGDR